jgi:hypothetical protein
MEGGRDYEVLKLHFKKHLRQATRLKRRPWKSTPSRDIRIIYEQKQAVWDIQEQLKRKPQMIAFDYETNMLKPDGELARIFSCSVCWDGVETTAFLWSPAVMRAMKKVLFSPIPKIASNIKFEDRWTRRFYGKSPKSWLWDTMLGAHVLDNRSGVTGLKFQSFVVLGEDSYDERLAPYLKARTGVTPNKIQGAPLAELLKYNALDSALEYELALVQMRQMNWEL